MRLLPFSLLCCLALWATASLVSAAEPAGLTCPAQVSADPKTAPAGWTATLSQEPHQTGPEPHRLEQVTFFDGPPAELASLVYDDIKPTGKEQVAVWKFGDNPRGFWISCGYSGTAVVLSQRLPAGIKTCRVTYDKTSSTAAGLPTIKKIDCR